MKIALDTNVLAYAEGANGAAMRDRALELIQRLPVGAVVLPVQTLGELFNVLVRKAKRRPARARAAVLSWRDAYPVVETSAAVMVNATDLASDHGLTIWDSVVLAASAEAECRLLLSEDLQEGFTWRGVTRKPVCADASPYIGGITHNARGVNPYAIRTDSSGNKRRLHVGFCARDLSCLEVDAGHSPIYRWPLTILGTR